MPIAVITGANAGIGHAFVNKFIAEGWTVYALDKVIGDDLKALKSEKAAEVDVSSEPSIKSFAESFGEGKLDLLLNVAGVMAHPEDDKLETVTSAVLGRTFAVNASGPLLLTQALLPALLRTPGSKIANVSSRVGSMGDNTSGGTYAYRASKAALNSISVSMSVELKSKGVTVLILHPGIVKTSLTPGSDEIPEAVEPEYAAEKLYGIIQSKGLEETGKFWHRDGYELPW
ncbi:NAD(P)-binding protein [Calocera cornea HHB12733]|uniref:NAD(P)-binding protein n=1 Tax=Calocera cornea HHB12733 TaxID=1353952 RepID=A0A165END3_9BASI|nr:NAD(P)-binding protein [Calocera cornea HHB12733]